MKANRKTLALLRHLLRDMFESRENGVAGLRFSRDHGYVDGFMAALVEEKLATHEELLALVLEERSRHLGNAPETPQATRLRARRPSMQLTYLGSDAV